MNKTRFIIVIACLVPLIVMGLALGWHSWLRSQEAELPIIIRNNPTNLCADDIILIRRAIYSKVGINKGSTFDLGFTDTGGNTVYAQSTIGGAERAVIVLTKEGTDWSVIEITRSLYSCDPDVLRSHRFPTMPDTAGTEGNVSAGIYALPPINDPWVQ